MRLVPREEKFFLYFLKQVKIITEAATILHDAARQGAARLAEVKGAIRDLEHRGDEVTHEILTRLNATFITPLDPEDIHSLAVHLDDIIDGIEETAHRLVSHRVDPVPAPVVELTGLIVECALALEKAFEALAKDRVLLEHCIEVNRLEDQADGVFRGAMAQLFLECRDPIELIKLKDVYEISEKTTDFCEDVADVLQGVIAKNS